MRSTPWLLAIVMLAGCGGAAPPEVPIEGTRARLLSGPAGQIAVVETPAGNREVEIMIDQLPTPQRYDRQASRFVVWIVPKQGVPIRAGELQYDRHRHFGRANVVTPYDDFRVLVTAEPATPASPEPSRNVVVDQGIAS